MGGSARSAAWSALRAGYAPIAADAFADVDLCEAARMLPVEQYPDDVARAVEMLAPLPWIYTGGLENSPAVISAINRRHHLLGNSPDVLREVRNPRLVTDVLNKAGLPALEVRIGGPREARPGANQVSESRVEAEVGQGPENRCQKPAVPRTDGRWLLKPLRSAGGRGIRVWTDDARDSSTLNEPHYFQRRAVGVPHSALFLAEPESATLVGNCRQWVGWKSLCAPEFAWCGCLGPVRLPEAIEEQIGRMAAVLARRFRLRGLFGIDLIVDADTAWLTEVNPRYTGGVEIFERAFDVPLLRLHQHACRADGLPPGASTTATTRETGRVARRFKATGEEPGRWRSTLFPRTESRRPELVVGKLIQYAPAPMTVPPLSQSAESRAEFFLRPYADLPEAGTTIAERDPVCTVLAAAGTTSQCVKQLAHRLSRLQRMLGLPTDNDAKSELSAD